MYVSRVSTATAHAINRAATKQSVLYVYWVMPIDIAGNAPNVPI
jgi:hypothetical protein